MTMRLEIKAFRYDSRSEARQLALAFTSSAGAAITATTGVVSAALLDGVVGDSDHVSCDEWRCSSGGDNLKGCGLEATPENLYIN